MGERVYKQVFSMHKRVLIKVIPHRTGSIYKFEFSHLHLALSVISGLTLFLAVLAFHIGSVRTAQSQVQNLFLVDASQRRQLAALSHETDIMWRRLHQLQRSNDEVRRLAAADAGILRVKPARPTHAFGAMGGGGEAIESSLWNRFKSWFPAHGNHNPVTFSSEATRLALLNYDVAQTLHDTASLRSQTQAIVAAKRAAQLARQHYLDAIPSLWPTNGYISSGFGYRTDPATEFHNGIDVVNDYGASVYATASGIVAEAGWDGGYGNKLVIDHGNGYETWYAHNSRIVVTAGQQVHKGQEIAQVGATGFATGPHVHYELLLWGKPINPTPYLNGIPVQVASAR